MAMMTEDGVRRSLLSMPFGGAPPGCASFDSSGGTPQDALAARCRSLARSVGHDAVQDQQHHPQHDRTDYPSPNTSPYRNAPHLHPPPSPSSSAPMMFAPKYSLSASAPISGSGSLSAGGSTSSSPSASAGAGAGHPQGAASLLGTSPVAPSGTSPRSATSYPTPEGSFLEDLIEEEMDEDGETAPQQSAATTAGPAAPTSSRGGATSRRDSGSGSAFGCDDSSDAASDVDQRRSRSTSFRSHAGFGFSSLKLYTQDLEHEANLRSLLRDGGSFVVVPITLVDGELLVTSGSGSSLSPENSLSSMYLDPLLEIYRVEGDSITTPSTPGGSNTPNHPLHRRRSSIASSSGGLPFQSTPSHPFLLLLDIQSSPSTTLQFVRHSLASLLDASLLTNYCPKSKLFTPGLVTVLLTGPSASELANEMGLRASNEEATRFVFAEADIASSLDEVAKEITPVAGGNLGRAVGGWNGESLDDEQREEVRRQVARAKAKGLKVRYDGLPKYPAHAREMLRSSLGEDGVDYY